MDVHAFAGRVADNVERVVRGKRAEIELLLLSVLCRGHVLIEDVPGTGKTVLARALATSLGLRVARVQGTPDLLPSEVTGTTVLRGGEFEFRAGPVFTDVLLFDEVNRATPRTQSALLEAMAERQVSVDGVARPLGDAFLVLATQNPIDHAGTFPLPEAQLDRFLLRLALGYPDRDDERAVLQARRGRDPLDELEPVVSPGDLPALYREVASVHTEPVLEDLVLGIVAATRTHRDTAVGASVRGSLALAAAARATAALRGRDFVVPEDVHDVAVPALAHRLVLRPEALLHSRSARDVVQDALAQVPVPVDGGDGG